MSRRGVEGIVSVERGGGIRVWFWVSLFVFILEFYLGRI